MSEKLFHALQDYKKRDNYPFHMPGHKRHIYFDGLPYDIDLTEIPGFDDLHHPVGMILELEKEMSEFYQSDMTKILVNGSSCGILAAINATICHFGQSTEACGLQCEEANSTHKKDCSLNIEVRSESEEVRLGFEEVQSESKEVRAENEGCHTACGRRNPRRVGNHLLVARNCHKSVFHALAINRDVARVRYILPQVSHEWGMCGAISPRSVEEAFVLEEQSFGEGCVAAFVMVSPTYEGIVSDIETIAGICHAHGAYLIVDEAHGAHFPFIRKRLAEVSVDIGQDDLGRELGDTEAWNRTLSTENGENLKNRGLAQMFPRSAIELGADFVIQSYHKTLPAMTQTAVIHVGREVSDFIKNRLCYQLGIFQSSSPSYVLMASISQCFAYMKGDESRKAVLDYVQLMNWFYENVAALKLRELKVLQPAMQSDYAVARENGDEWCYGWDFSKVVIAIRQGIFRFSETEDGSNCVCCDGEWLERELRERFLLQMEMATPDYVVAMTTIADQKAGLERLLEALRIIDQELSDLRSRNCCSILKRKSTSDMWIFSQYIGEAVDKPAVCMNLPEQAIELVKIDEAVGRISCDFLYMYPPGIPFVVPGERITKKAANMANDLVKGSYTIYGLDRDGRIRVRR